MLIKVNTNKFSSSPKLFRGSQFVETNAVFHNLLLDTKAGPRRRGNPNNNDACPQSRCRPCLSAQHFRPRSIQPK